MVLRLLASVISFALHTILLASSWLIRFRIYEYRRYKVEKYEWVLNKVDYKQIPGVLEDKSVHRNRNLNMQRVE